MMATARTKRLIRCLEEASYYTREARELGSLGDLSASERRVAASALRWALRMVCAHEVLYACSPPVRRDETRAIILPLRHAR